MTYEATRIRKVE